MLPRFNEEKTTQTACLLLQLAGGRLSILKLMKLLYIVDREALQKWGQALSDDNYVSMPHGPVLSNTLDAANRKRDAAYWTSLIAERSGYWLGLETEDCPQDQLSQAEIELIREVHHEHGWKSALQLRDHCHGFAEYKDPDGSSFPIALQDILRALGKSPEDIELIEDETSAIAYARSILV